MHKLLLIVGALAVAAAQQFDVIIRNGLVIDPKNEIDQQRLDIGNLYIHVRAVINTCNKQRTPATTFKM